MNHKSLTCFALVVMIAGQTPFGYAQTIVVSEKTISLHLADVLRLGVAKNPTIAVGKAQILQAEAVFRQSEAGKHFQLTFNSSTSYSNVTLNQPPPIHETFGSVQSSLTIPLPVGPKANLQVSQSQYQLDVAQSQLKSSELSLNNSLGSAFFDLLLQQSLLDEAEEANNEAIRQEKNTVARNKAGDVPLLDVEEAKLRTATSNTDLIRAKESLTVSQETLNTLIGVPIDSPTTAVADMITPTLPSYTLQKARDLAFAYSPDIAIAKEQTLADEAALNESKHANDPQWNLQLVDGRSGDTTSFSRQDSLAASVTVPLDDGGIAHSQVDQAKYALQAVVYNEKVAANSVLLSVSTSYSLVQSSFAELQSVEEASALAQTTYDKTQLGYQNGLYPFTDVMTAESALHQAKIAVIQANYALANAEFSLANEVGVDQDSADISTMNETGEAAH